jgi:hypothetical protein
MYTYCSLLTIPIGDKTLVWRRRHCTRMAATYWGRRTAGYPRWVGWGFPTLPATPTAAQPQPPTTTTYTARSLMYQIVGQDNASHASFAYRVGAEAVFLTFKS